MPLIPCIEPVTERLKRDKRSVDIVALHYLIFYVLFTGTCKLSGA
jgi:hypothetical protein